MNQRFTKLILRSLFIFCSVFPIQIATANNVVNIRSLSGKCLDVHGPDYGARIDGAKVQSWDCLGGENQQWVLEDKQIKSQNGLCLDLDSNDTKNGAKIQLWRCHGGPNQQWSYENKQIKAQNGLCLDLDANRSDNGAKVHMWQCNGVGHQQWLTSNFLPLQQLVDRYKPTYHFAKQIGASPFDPNGALYFNGKYHLMYIFQGRGQSSSGEVSDGHQYGHATSTDLFHWTDKPASLTDGRNFSGNAFLDKSGRPVIIYHMTGLGNSIAVSKDNDMISWEKPGKYTPLKTTVPQDHSNTPDWGKFDSWDPHGWLENDKYYSIFGGSQPALFKSDDMENWVYQGPFIGSQWRDGVDMSCPKFFPLGDKYVFMFISHDTGSQFVVGEWKNEKFFPETHRTMNWPGGTFFAPETLLDNQGRRIMWAWVIEARGDLTGRIGVMSLPRVFTIDDKHVVHMNPPKEVELLRSQHQVVKDMILSNYVKNLSTINGDTLELKLDMDLTNVSKAGVKVLQSADGREETIISYDTKSQTLNLDVSRSSLDPVVNYSWGNPKVNFPERLVQSAPLKLGNENVLSLRVFIDRSIVEVFANGTEVITARVYPSLDSSKQVSLFSEGTAYIYNIESWNLAL